MSPEDQIKFKAVLTAEQPQNINDVLDISERLGDYELSYYADDEGAFFKEYRRTTWSKNGRKKIVWRCISRLDYGTKYCKNSPSIEEGVLQNAIAAAITRKAQTEGANVQRIREHIEMYLNSAHPD